MLVNTRPDFIKKINFKTNCFNWPTAKMTLIQEKVYTPEITMTDMYKVKQKLRTNYQIVLSGDMNGEDQDESHFAEAEREMLRLHRVRRKKHLLYKKPINMGRELLQLDVTDPRGGPDAEYELEKRMEARKKSLLEFTLPIIPRPEDRVRQIKQSLMDKLYKSPLWLAPKKSEFQTQLNKLKKYPTLAKSTLNNKFLQNNIFLHSTGRLKSDAIRTPNPFTEVNKYLVNRQKNA